MSTSTARLSGTHLSAEDKGIGSAWLDEGDETLSNTQLLNSVEEVEKAGCMDYSDLASQSVESSIVKIQHVPWYKGGVDHFAILEERIAEVEEPCFEVCAV